MAKRMWFYLIHNYSSLVSLIVVNHKEGLVWKLFVLIVPLLPLSKFLHILLYKLFKFSKLLYVKSVKVKDIISILSRLKHYVANLLEGVRRELLYHLAQCSFLCWSWQLRLSNRLVYITIDGLHFLSYIAKLLARCSPLESNRFHLFA